MKIQVSIKPEYSDADAICVINITSDCLLRTGDRMWIEWDTIVNNIRYKESGFWGYKPAMLVHDKYADCIFGKVSSVLNFVKNGKNNIEIEVDVSNSDANCLSNELQPTLIFNHGSEMNFVFDRKCKYKGQDYIITSIETSPEDDGEIKGFNIIPTKYWSAGKIWEFQLSKSKRNNIIKNVKISELELKGPGELVRGL